MQPMSKLGVNIEPVAVLRDKGKIPEADPITAAMMADLGGADLIVCPLREGFHPITEKDVKLLKTMVRLPIELHIFAVDALIGFALSVAPDMVTLVPGKPTDPSEGAKVEFQTNLEDLEKTVKDVRSMERRVGLWIEPEIQRVKAAASLGVDYVKFHLGRLSELRNASERSEFLENTGSVVLAASKMGLGIAVEGGVDYHNAAEIAALGKIHHVSVGGSIAARALCVGMEQAVRDMVGLVH
jgi:pyridoxine 5-phosphate synthase